MAPRPSDPRRPSSSRSGRGRDADPGPARAIGRLGHLPGRRRDVDACHRRRWSGMDPSRARGSWLHRSRAQAVRATQAPRRTTSAARGRVRPRGIVATRALLGPDMDTIVIVGIIVLAVVVLVWWMWPRESRTAEPTNSSTPPAYGPTRGPFTATSSVGGSTASSSRPVASRRSTSSRSTSHRGSSTPIADVYYWPDNSVHHHHHSTPSDCGPDHTHDDSHRSHDYGHSHSDPSCSSSHSDSSSDSSCGSSSCGGSSD
jgi:hypothetical protein